ncbi:MAG: DUF6449 domain-containing protein [Clostridiales bacterium]|nr:DUF6449 domain-containing protein [Clostridiales bacterium]
MMCKNSYFDFKLLKDKLKKSAWILTLYSVALFFAITVANTIQLQNLKNYLTTSKLPYKLINEQSVRDRMSGMFSVSNKMISFLIVAFAIVAALTVFYYITSKKQTDFFHSLPLRREKLFTVAYLAGVLYFVLPYLINTVLSLAIAGGIGLFQYVDVSAVIFSVLINLLYYLVIYSICVFACVLCGNMIVAMLGSFVFLGYFSALIEFWLLQMSQSYKTFYEGYYHSIMYLRNSSPVADLFCIKTVQDVSALRATVYVMLTVILVILSVFLYKKRPSEAAGHAMAFRVSKPFIKYPLVFVIALFGGLFFYSVGNQSTEWMIFGYLSGIILSHMVIEIIYHFEFKAIFKELKGLLVFSVLFAAMVMVMSFDVTGFDKKVPSLDSVKSVSVSLNGMDSLYSNLGVFNKEDYLNRERTILSSFTLSDQNNIKAAVTLAKLGTEGLKYKDSGVSRETETVGMIFTLSNGQKMIRRYDFIDSATGEQYMIQICNSGEYKEKLYHSFDDKAFSANHLEIKSSYFRSTNSVIAVLNNPDQIKALAVSAAEDLKSLDLIKMKSAAPSMVLEFSWRLKRTDIESADEIITRTIFVPIYDNAPRTKALFKEYGIEIPERIKASQVDNITVNVYDAPAFTISSANVNQNAQYAVSTSDKGATITLSDKNDIANILPYLIPEESSQYNPFLKIDHSCRVTVYSRTFRNGYSENMVFEKDKMPSFLKDKIAKLMPIQKES